MPTNTIREILGSRDFETRNGLFTSFKVELDNAAIGEITKKRGNVVKAGDTIEYTIEPNGSFPDKFKLVQANSNFGGGGNSGGGKKWNGDGGGKNESFALSYAKDILIANIKADVSGREADLMVAAELATRIADKFYNWLESKKATTPSPQPETSVQPTQSAPATQTGNFPPSQRPENPMATGTLDAATQAQLGAIAKLAEVKGVDAQVECEGLYDGLRLSDLNKAAASFLIDSLRAM